MTRTADEAVAAGKHAPGTAGPVGIMADSHGKAEAIVEALDYLRGRGCARIYHLGDICDSLKPETAAACVTPLRAQGVRAVKGNNDHALVASYGQRDDGIVPREVLQYLRDLPLVEAWGRTLFTHSLPFAREMGLSCMIGGFGETEAETIFKAFPDRILFRGHAHGPEAVWRDGGNLRRLALEPDRGLSLSSKIPCVVTCGALTRGLCIIYRPGEASVECATFEGI